MNSFKYHGDNLKIQQSVNMANKLHSNIVKLLNEAMVKEFKCAKIGSKQLAHIISKHAGMQCEVRTYYYWRSKVLGKFVPSQPEIIWLNTKALGRSKASIVCTLWHERVHFLDHLEKDLSFGHDGNTYYKWKEQTAPYFVDYLAEKSAAYYFGEDQSQRTDNTKVYIPWYWRLAKWIKRKLT